MRVLLDEFHEPQVFDRRTHVFISSPCPVGALRALPAWLRLVIAVQSLLPAAIVWYQQHLLAFKDFELVRMHERILEMKSLPDDQYRQILQFYGEVLQSSVPHTKAFLVLIGLNGLLAAIGCALLAMLVWKANEEW